MPSSSSVGNGFGLGCGLVFGLVAAFGLLAFFVCGGIGGLMSLGDLQTRKDKKLAVDPEATVEMGVRASSGDVGVSVRHVYLGKVEGKTLGQPGHSDEEHLSIVVHLRNGNQSRTYEYKSWSIREAFGDNAELRDDLGNSYRAVSFDLLSEVAGQVKHASLYSDKTVADMLVYQRPVPKAQMLLLTLPLSRCGEKGKVTFRIPVAKIKNEPPS